MNGEEEIRAFTIGDRRALFQRNELVTLPREHDLDTRLILQELLQPEGHIEHQFRFGDPVCLRAWIVPAVPGVDDNPRDSEAQLPGE